MLLPARVRSEAGWSDACILNVSSRGLMIHSPRPVGLGTTVELRHADHAILAEVVWRSGSRLGLCAVQRVPVDEIVTLGQSDGLQLTATPPRPADRRRRPRDAHASRTWSRAFEFAAIVIVAGSLSSLAAAMVSDALARPLGQVGAVLAGPAAATQ